jgi:hypothetical protein
MIHETRSEEIDRADGVYASVTGLGVAFRFRLGVGSVRRVNSGPILLWLVHGNTGIYSVQLVPHTVSADKPANSSEVLGGHYRWETDFLRDRLGVTADHESIGALQHPEGTPVLTWICRKPLEKLPSAPPDFISATPYSAHATLLHRPAHLIHFLVTGAEKDSWSEYDLRIQVLRTAFSYYPHQTVRDDQHASATT